MNVIKKIQQKKLLRKFKDLCFSLTFFISRKKEHKEHTSMVVIKNLWVSINLYKICLSVITWNKKHSWKQAVPIVYTLGKKVSAVATFKGL